MAHLDFRPVVLNVGLADNLSCWNYHNVVGPFARVYYVLDNKCGNARIVVENKEYKLQPGKIYLIPPFVSHDELCDGPFSHIYLHIYDHSAAESIFDKYVFPVEVEADANVKEMIEFVLRSNPGRQLCEYEPKAYSGPDSIAENLYSSEEQSMSNKLQMRGVLYCLMARFFEGAKVKHNVKDVQIRKSLSYINENLSDPALSVDRLAEMASLSENQYIRRFRTKTGMTPLQYITGKRIEKAQVLLLGEDASVKKVGLNLGFVDSAYFCRVFKKIVGLTPMKFKAKFK